MRSYECTHSAFHCTVDRIVRSTRKTISTAESRTCLSTRNVRSFVNHVVRTRAHYFFDFFRQLKRSHFASPSPQRRRDVCRLFRILIANASMYSRCQVALHVLPVRTWRVQPAMKSCYNPQLPKRFDVALEPSRPLTSYLERIKELFADSTER